MKYTKTESLERIKPRPPCYNDDISALLADNEEITRSCHTGGLCDHESGPGV